MLFCCDNLIVDTDAATSFEERAGVGRGRGRGRGRVKKEIMYGVFDKPIFGVS